MNPKTKWGANAVPFSAPKYGVEESLRQGRAAFRKLDEELRELGLHQFGVDATR